MSEVILSSENWNNEVVKSKTPVIIDFWASWCGPCRMLAPVIEEIADEYSGKIKVCKVNVDDEPELASNFKINSIPTLLVFKGGELVNTAVGYREKKDVLSLVEQ